MYYYFLFTYVSMFDRFQESLLCSYWMIYTVCLITACVWLYISEYEIMRKASNQLRFS